jgi:hypothetical protein
LDRGTVEERNKARKQQRAYYTQYVQPTAEAIGKLLNEQPWYAPLRMFYRACRSVAKNAMRQDQYAGVQIVDPFDGTTVRWNPVEFGRYRYIGEWGEMTLRLPGRWKTAAKRDPKTGRPQKRNHEDFEHAVAKPTTGDYPVSQRRLLQALPPYIVHMLDAALSGLVLELLEGDGLPYLALHDAWYMAGVGETEHSIFTDELVGSPLWTRVQIALVAWDRSLGPVYDTLIRYLGDDPEFRDWAYEIKARWIERKTAPRFVLSEARKSAPIWPESD